MLGSLKFAVLQFADFHFPQNPRIARTPCSLQVPIHLWMFNHVDNSKFHSDDKNTQYQWG